MAGTTACGAGNTFDHNRIASCFRSHSLSSVHPAVTEISCILDFGFSILEAFLRKGGMGMAGLEHFTTVHISKQCFRSGVDPLRALMDV